MTIEKIREKYENIEDKIPSIWENYEVAGIQLAQDIIDHWDIKDSELIRVIALIGMRFAGIGKTPMDLSSHIYQPFAFAGLYPERMQIFNISPSNIKS